MQKAQAEAAQHSRNGFIRLQECNLVLMAVVIITCPSFRRSAHWQCTYQHVGDRVVDGSISQAETAMALPDNIANEDCKYDF
jgi:hypothetical protein